MSTSESKVIREGKTDVTRITILEANGSETVINVTENVHFLVAFAKVDMKVKDVGHPMELMIKGDPRVCGEMFYQMGDRHPELVAYCAVKSLNKAAKEMTLDKIIRDAEPVGGVN